MSNQGDKTSRIERAAYEARRSFDQARTGQDGSKPPGRLQRLRNWCNRHLYGGEVTFWVVAIIVLLALLAWLLTPGAGSMFGGRQMSEAQSVAVDVAKKSDVRVRISALGTVTPIATATVTPQVSGQVTEVKFKEGQMVKAGDVLAQIDPRSYQAALEEAQGQLAQDEATLANAKIDLDRQRKLFNAKATSQQDLDDAKATYRKAEGAVIADKGTVAAAKLKLDFTQITAPISGRIGLRGVDVGNYVASGQSTGIATITQIDPMSVLFAIPEDSVSMVLSRLNSGAELPVEVFDRALSKKIASGSLTAIDSEIATTTGTVKLRAVFDNRSQLLFPNQFVNVKLLVKTLHNQVVIPTTAIQRGSQGTYVYVVNANKVVTMRAIDLGQQDGDIVAVTKGLNVGETVVTDGADRLSEGSAVKIPSGKKVEDVEAAESARVLKQRNTRRSQFILMRKLKPEEHKMLSEMSREDRVKWLKDHREELLKRKDQPMPPGGFGGPGGPPPGGGPGGPPPP